jgi:hypothetical protein
VLTFPDNDPKMPIKFNLLWLIVNNGPMDIDGLYTALIQIRGMPLHLVKVHKKKDKEPMPDEPEFKDNNKHKYTQIRRAFVQLRREGWPIHKQLINGIAWYGMGKGFTLFFLTRLKEYLDDILTRHDRVQRYAARPDVQARYLKKMNPSKKLMVKRPEITFEDGQMVVPLKLVPFYLQPLKDITLKEGIGERVRVPGPSVKKTVAMRRGPRKRLKEIGDALKDIESYLLELKDTDRYLLESVTKATS